MSSDSPPTSDERSDPIDTRAHVEKLEAHLPRREPFAPDRFSTVYGHVTEYEQAETAEEEQDVLDKFEDELEELRDAVEREVDEGKETAHELLDDLEARVSNLRE